jgi:hypothetical protein
MIPERNFLDDVSLTNIPIFPDPRLHLVMAIDREEEASWRRGQ